MSIQYIIYNNKTNKYLYCTQGFGHIDPEHLFGDVKTVANNLYKHLYCRPGYEIYHKQYSIWAAHIIAQCVADCTKEDVWIDQDTYFATGYEEIDISMYQK